MQLLINYLLMVLLLIGSITGEVHNACEICTCDNLDKPMMVVCDSKNLTTLTGIVFNSSIEILSLVNNSLTLKSADDLATINNITSLKSLILSNNPLSTIPELSLPHLVDLQLNNTDLQNATFPSSYENCTSLQSIVLSNNKLISITSTDFISLSSVTKIILDHTQLNSIANDTFIRMSNNLQSISLASNSIHSGEFMSTMDNLLSINLDQNQFQQLPTEMMKLSRTKQFFFRNNQINIIDELSPLFYWTKTNITDIEVYLNNNPFDCCQSRWFIHYLNGPMNLVKDFMNLTCAAPKAYTGKRLIDLRADLMDCSIDPVNPPKHHTNKLAVLISCLIAVVSFILAVVGVTLYRRNRLYFGRRQQYEPVQGVDIHT